MKTRVLVLCIVGIGVIASQPLFAQSSSGGGSGGNAYGLRMDGAIGQPSSSITNPDGTIAYYNGIALQGRLIAPIYVYGSAALSLTGTLRYLDLKNTASEKAETEIANHIGPGIGAMLSFGKLYAGVDISYMLARHYTVGTISRSVEYQYSPQSYYGGVSFPLGQLSFGFSYTVISGTVPKANTKLSVDSPYADNLILFHLTWNSGTDTAKFMGSLLK